MMKSTPATRAVRFVVSIWTPFLAGIDDDGWPSSSFMSGVVGFDLCDRDQRQAEVAHPSEQAVQRGLVDDRTVDAGRAVAVVGEGHPVEPGRPSGVEVALEADLVPSGPRTGAGRCVRLAHGASVPLSVR